MEQNSLNALTTERREALELGGRTYYTMGSTAFGRTALSTCDAIICKNQQHYISVSSVGMPLLTAG